MNSESKNAGEWKNPINTIIRKFQKSPKTKVYALVGETGTGKSFRARLVTEKYNIDLLIDDGLLIQGQRILAGKSAKREKNQLTAIRRAIFEDPENALEIRRALKNVKFRSILLIGTSEKMVAKIVERLELPYPDHTIYIEDVATQEEIAQARDSRRMSGKHIIPVPVIQVKQHPPHRVLDTIRIFLKTHPFMFWKKQVVEKTVVQPPFSRRGRLTISETAMSQMIMHCIKEYSKDIQIRKIGIDKVLNGYEIEVRLIIPFRVNIPDQLSNLQTYIITNIERYSGIHIERLHLTVDQMV